MVFDAGLWGLKGFMGFMHVLDFHRGFSWFSGNMLSFLALGLSVYWLDLVPHGARALEPNGFRFRLISRRVPGG